MVMSCCAINCTERYKKDSGVKFHKFPSDSNRRKLWVLALKRNNFNVNDHTSICSKHFSKECYQKSVDGTKDVLKKTAIPDIFNFSTTTKHVKKQKSLNCSPSTETNTETDAKNALSSSESGVGLTNIPNVLDCSLSKTPMKPKNPLICLPLTETIVEKTPSELQEVIPDKLKFSYTKTPIKTQEPRIYLPPSESELLAVDLDIFNLSSTAKPIEKQKPLIYLRRPFSLRYVGDISTENMSNETKLKFNLVINTLKQKKLKVNSLQKQNIRLKKKIQSNSSTENIYSETKQTLDLTTNTIKKKKLKVRSLQKQNFRLRNKVSFLKELVTELKTHHCFRRKYYKKRPNISNTTSIDDDTEKLHNC